MCANLMAYTSTAESRVENVA